MAAKRTPETYTQEVQDKYPTLKVFTEYKKRNQKIKYQCSTCTYIWKANAFPIKGCPSCEGRIKLDTKNYFSMPVEKNPLVVYRKTLKEKWPRIILTGKFISKYQTAEHRCTSCNTMFDRKPWRILAVGCTTCTYRRSRAYTPDSYRVALMTKCPTIECWDDYVSSAVAIEHSCIKCEHKWTCKPISKNRLEMFCPNCTNTGFSRVAIRWLEGINPMLQTALNGSEFRIPKTRFFVDGYDWNTHTVYEFLGDCWHGNLDVYDPNYQCNPYSDKTAQELNDYTYERLHIIKNLGYKIIYIWEDDYRRGDNYKILI